QQVIKCRTLFLSEQPNRNTIQYIRFVFSTGKSHGPSFLSRGSNVQSFLIPTAPLPMVPTPDESAVHTSLNVRVDAVQRPLARSPERRVRAPGLQQRPFDDCSRVPLSGAVLDVV